MSINSGLELIPQKARIPNTRQFPSLSRLLVILCVAANVCALFFFFFLSRLTDPSGRNFYSDLIALIIFFVSAIVLVPAIFFFRYFKKQKRIRALQPFAARNGWTFVANPRVESFPDFESCAIFRGQRKEIVNLLKRPYEAGEAFIFDCHYTVRTEKCVSHYRETVFAFRTPHLHLPYFALSAQLEKLFSVFLRLAGYGDINFDTHPKFSKLFHLRGGDETRVRHLFQPRVLSLLESMPKIRLNGGGNYLFVYSDNQIVAGENLDAHFKRASDIYNLLRH